MKKLTILAIFAIAFVLPMGGKVHAAEGAAPVLPIAFQSGLGSTFDGYASGEESRPYTPVQRRWRRSRRRWYRRCWRRCNDRCWVRAFWNGGGRHWVRRCTRRCARRWC